MDKIIVGEHPLLKLCRFSFLSCVISSLPSKRELVRIYSIWNLFVDGDASNIKESVHAFFVLHQFKKRMQIPIQRSVDHITATMLPLNEQKTQTSPPTLPIPLIGPIVPNQVFTSPLYSFSTTDRSLYQFIGKPRNKTEDDYLQSLHPRRRHAFHQAKLRASQNRLDNLRSTLNPTISVSPEQFRASLPSGNFTSTTYVGRPITDFIHSDRNHGKFTSPMLVDAFSYCEDTTYVVEAIFNLRYMYIYAKRSPTREALHDQWFCIHDNITQPSLYPVDNHKHIVATVFKFQGHCTQPTRPPQSLQVYLYSKSTHHQYNLEVEFLPSFTNQRWYLSLCTMIENVPVSQIRVFLNHHLAYGVQHFIMYVNSGLAAWRSRLQPYLQRGLLELVDFAVPNHGPFYEQAAALNSCNRRQRYATQYMIYSDVDEFFFPMNHTLLLPHVLQMYAEAYPYTDAFSIRNAFYDCPYYGSEDQWRNARKVTDICTHRSVKVVKGMRQKNIVRVRTTPFVQVHEISYGWRMYMNHHVDMYMLHLKVGKRQKPSMRIVYNDFVSKVLSDEVPLI